MSLRLCHPNHQIDLNRSRRNGRPARLPAGQACAGRGSCGTSATSQAFRRQIGENRRGDFTCRRNALVLPHRPRDANGPVAQWSEPAAHNRLVGGSSPPGPTTQSWWLYIFVRYSPKPAKFPALSASFQKSLRLCNAQLCPFGPRVSASEIPFPGALGASYPETGSSLTNLAGSRRHAETEAGSIRPRARHADR